AVKSLFFSEGLIIFSEKLRIRELKAEDLDRYTLIDSYIYYFFPAEGFDITLVRFSTNWVKPLRAEVEKAPISCKRKQAVPMPIPIKKEQPLEIDLKAFPPMQPLPDSDKEEEIQSFIKERLQEASVKEQLREASVKAGDTVEPNEEAEEAYNNNLSNKRQRISVDNSNTESYSLFRAGRVRRASAKVRNS
ncbi:unnamed protein product, partial [Clonostachys byssicola]